MKPTFVIYGNCQGGVLEQATKFMPSVRDTYDVIYLRSFEHPTEGRGTIDPGTMARCAVLWNQHDEQVPFEYAGPTRADMKVVTFPAVDLGVLWPFQTHDPLFGPDARHEYGMFPYGDRVLIQVAEEGLAGDAGLARASELALRSTADMNRRLDLEMLRLVRREQKSQVRMAAFVISSFKSERLFWAYNHPTKRLLRELLNRLTEATWPQSREPADPLHRIGDRVFAEWDPLADLHVPVSRPVAEALGLAWWRRDLGYRFHGDRTLTEQEYAALYLAERTQRQAARPVAAIQSPA
ncbi:MAG: hypothetical protein RJA99_1671 [Pseudomonadota bacterium]